MVAWVAQFLFYAALVGAATAVSWRRPEGLVGVTLCLCLMVTEVSYFTSSLASRVTLEVIQAAVIVNSARLAFLARRGTACAAVVALSVLDLAFCALVAVGMFDGRWQGFIYGNVTNAVFLLQCVSVATPGIRDAYVGRARARAAGRLVGGGDAPVHAVRPDGRA